MKIPLKRICALLPSATGFDLRLHAGPKKVSVATAQPGAGMVQPVNGGMQPLGKLSVLASTIITVAEALNPPGAPIDAPPVAPVNVTVKDFGPSSTPSCKMGTLIVLVPVSPLAQTRTPDCAVKSVSTTAVPARVA